MPLIDLGCGDVSLPAPLNRPHGGWSMPRRRPAVHPSPRPALPHGPPFIVQFAANVRKLAEVVSILMKTLRQQRRRTTFVRNS
jgi:hypothetical protein